MVSTSAAPRDPGPALGCSESAGKPGWLATAGGAIYAVYHAPAQADRSRSPVLLVPPFGWDELTSYRARRFWAITLARAGHGVLRIDLPTTAESEGHPKDEGVVTRCTEAILAAAAWLKRSTGCGQATAFGLGLGGLLTLEAIRRGAPVRDVLLWNTRGTGGAAIRELVAMAALCGQAQGEAPPLNGMGLGDLDVAGFLLSAQTRADLHALDVRNMGLKCREGRALLIGRDHTHPDPKLVEALTNAGYAVKTLVADDYRDLVNHPQAVDLRRPHKTIRASLEWLALAAQHRGSWPEQANVAGSAHALQLHRRIAHHGACGQWEERVLELRSDAGRTFAVVTSARQTNTRLAVVVFSSGAIRKIGLQRMTVEFARRWALRGVATVRLDLEAIGDADGPEDRGEDERKLLTEHNLVSERAVMISQQLLDQLRALEISDRWLTMGYCSGAYLAFHALLTEPELVGCFSIDQQTLWESQAHYQDRIFRLALAAIRRGLWRRLRDQGITAHELQQVLTAGRYRFRRPLSARRRERLDLRRAEAVLRRLAERGQTLELFFMQGNPLATALQRSAVIAELLDQVPSFTVNRLGGEDHDLRAIALQAEMHAALDRAIERLLARL